MRREDIEPMTVWTVAPTSGQPETLAEGEIRTVGPWLPAGDLLLLGGLGLVDRQGTVHLRDPGETAAWSADGKKIWISGTLYEVATRRLGVGE